MKKVFQFPTLGEVSFDLSANNRIDSKKYSLYEVLVDPNLDSLSINDRLGLYQNWYEDAQMNKMTTHQRVAFDGCTTRRKVYSPLSGNMIEMINMASNDYLNMSQHPKAVEAGIKALQQYGTGSGAAPNATGTTNIKHELEQEIASTFRYDKALVFPTGFMTNTGVLNAMLRKNDIAIVDMLAHASILDGVNGKNHMFFLHNDMYSLETVLKRADRQYTNKIVVVDAVYSMDGDIANLPEIAALCKKYDAMLMVDEAHAFGVIGKNGLGILDHFDMQPETIDILVGTMSKAIGSQGGFVTGSEKLINYLLFASRPYMFSTAPYIAANASALEAVKIIREDSATREKLWHNIKFFSEKLKHADYNTGNSETAIMPVILGDHNLVMDLTHQLSEKGILVNGIPYPAVSRKQTRLRLTITAALTDFQLDIAFETLCKLVEDSRDNLLMEPEAQYKLVANTI